MDQFPKVNCAKQLIETKLNELKEILNQHEGLQCRRNEIIERELNAKKEENDSLKGYLNSKDKQLSTRKKIISRLNETISKKDDELIRAYQMILKVRKEYEKASEARIKFEGKNIDLNRHIDYLHLTCERHNIFYEKNDEELEQEDDDESSADDENNSQDDEKNPEDDDALEVVSNVDEGKENKLDESQCSSGIVEDEPEINNDEEIGDDYHVPLRNFPWFIPTLPTIYEKDEDEDEDGDDNGENEEQFADEISNDHDEIASENPPLHETSMQENESEINEGPIIVDDDVIETNEENLQNEIVKFDEEVQTDESGFFFTCCDENLECSSLVRENLSCEKSMENPEIIKHDKQSATKKPIKDEISKPKEPKQKKKNPKKMKKKYTKLATIAVF